jgi:hypothetical protein
MCASACPLFLQAVTEPERREIVASYLDSLLTAQLQAQEVAEARLKQLYL